jgi:hypothetical protein
MRYLIYLNGSVVSWKSFQQEIITDSITKAKHISKSEV